MLHSLAFLIPQFSGDSKRFAVGIFVASAAIGLVVYLGINAVRAYNGYVDDTRKSAPERILAKQKFERDRKKHPEEFGGGSVDLQAPVTLDLAAPLKQQDCGKLGHTPGDEFFLGYSRLQAGMSYEQVIRTLGGYPNPPAAYHNLVQSRSKVVGETYPPLGSPRGVVTWSYGPAWTTPPIIDQNGMGCMALLIVQFQDGKLVASGRYHNTNDSDLQWLFFKDDQRVGGVENELPRATNSAGEFAQAREPRPKQ